MHVNGLMKKKYSKYTVFEFKLTKYLPSTMKRQIQLKIDKFIFLKVD